MSDEDALTAIRLRTRESHLALERLPIWNAAFGSLAAYARLLDALASLASAGEGSAAIALGDRAPPWHRSETRMEWLRSDRLDVAELRHESVDDVSPASGDSELAEVARSSPAAAAGVLYVFEGSALGGRELAKRLHAGLGLDRDRGGRYFFGYGEGTGARWKAFTAWLRSALVDAEETQVAAAASERTFQRFHSVLSELGHE